MLNFRVENFLYKRTYSMKTCRRDFQLQLARDRDSEAWKSFNKLAVFKDTLCKKKNYRKYLERFIFIQF